MIVGFNHNVNYRGVAFHVQTEDSGLKNPQLVTLLYYGGTIIASQKTVYADILKVDNLDQVVEDLAKEQHKGMLRKLTKGEFDQRIIDLGIPLSLSAAGGQQIQASQPAAEPSGKPLPAPAAEAPSQSPAAAGGGAKSVSPSPSPEGAKSQAKTGHAKIVEEPIVDKFRKPKPATERTLEDLIFAYLTGTDG